MADPILTRQTPVRPLAFIVVMVGAWVGILAAIGAAEVKVQAARQRLPIISKNRLPSAYRNAAAQLRLVEISV